MSVNQKRTKRMSRSWTIAFTSSAVLGCSRTAIGQAPSEAGGEGGGGNVAAAPRRCAADGAVSQELEPSAVYRHSAQVGVGPRLQGTDRRLKRHALQIGRASCRERV